MNNSILDPLFLVSIFSGADHRMGRQGLKAVELIVLQFFLEDVLDALVGVEIKTDGPFACFVKALSVVFLSKAQDTHTDLVCLFRMLSALQDMGDDVFHMLTSISCPVDEALRIPAADEPVMRGHMIRTCRVSARPAVSLMEGYAFVFMEELDHRISVCQLHRAAPVPVRHAVIVPVIA